MLCPRQEANCCCIDNVKLLQDLIFKNILTSVNLRVEVTKPRGGDQKKEVETKPRLFVGDIKEAIEKEQLTAAFQKFGTITDIWVAHNPPGDAPKGQPSIECIACSILLPTQVLVDYSLQVSTDKQSQELTRLRS